MAKYISRGPLYVYAPGLDNKTISPRWALDTSTDIDRFEEVLTTRTRVSTLSLACRYCGRHPFGEVRVVACPSCGEAYS